MSVDFVLPRSTEPLRVEDGLPIRFAPLLFLPKGGDEPFDPQTPLGPPEPHFANFDFRDETNRALSLPSREWNGLVTAEMVLATLDDALARHPQLRLETRVDSGMYPALRAIAREIATVDVLTALRLLQSIRDDEVDEDGLVAADQDLLRRLDSADEVLSKLLDAAAVSSVVAMRLVGDAACSGIYKLAYDMQVADLRSQNKPLQRIWAGLGWFGYPLWIETPYVGAATYHFEIEAPDGLEIYDAGLVRVASPVSGGHASSYVPLTEEQQQYPLVDRVSGFTARLHLYDHSAISGASALVWVQLRTRRQDFVAGALLASFVVAVVLWAAYLLADQAAKVPASTSTLLLLFPSLIAAYVVRPGPHPLTVRMLRWARLLVGVAALLPFIAAALVALPARDRDGHVINPHFEPRWLALAVIASGIVGALLASRLAPQPAVDRQRLLNPEHPEPWLTRRRRGRVERHRLRRVLAWIRGKRWLAENR